MWTWTPRRALESVSRGDDESPPRLLDQNDTLALKGAAILAIAFHNYFHLLSSAHENEFDCSGARFAEFLSTLQDPHQSVQAAFSYLGHFGVQVFIFLSAYGLASRHWRTPAGPGFLRERLSKIYPAFLAVVITWAVLTGAADGPFGSLAVLMANSKSLVLTLLGVSNVWPGLSFPPVGPWWFIPFIVQWYLLWPLVRRITDRFGARGVMTIAAAGVFLMATLGGLLHQQGINLMKTPLGHMPELCLGIMAARFEAKLDRTRIILMAGGIFIAANLCPSLWLLGFPCATIVMVGSYIKVKGLLRRARPVLAHVGTSSMALFLVNGFVRFPFAGWAMQEKLWFVVLIAGIISTGWSLAIAELMPRSA